MLSTLLQQKKRFSSYVVSPYFATTKSIQELKLNFEHKDLAGTESISEKIGGRIIGRRKASKSLLFLDLSSNGSNV